MVRYIKQVLLILPIVFLVACFKDEHSVSVAEKKHNLQEVIHYENVVPVVIIGSGPAGLSAAVYVSRAGMKSFVFAGPTPRGQLTQTTYIENWPGREKVLGAHLMSDIEKQAVSFGTTIINDTITKLDVKNWPFSITTEEGRSFKALSVILATGATPKTLQIPGERQYWGKGVTTCAVCDAPFFEGKEVVISGGGDSAAEMVFELAPYAKKVTMLVRKDHMKAAVAMQERVLNYPNAQVEYNKEIKEVYGNGENVTGIEVYDNKLDMIEKRDIDGVFLAIGHTPNSKLIKEQVPLDDMGYIKMQGRSQESLVPGVFAAGEIQDPSYRQAIVAAGEGVKAALDTTSFLYSIGFDVQIGKKLDKQFFETFSDDKIEIRELYERKELYEYVIDQKGVVFLDFYATTCPACIKMIPVIESVAHKYQDSVKFYKVNYDKVFKTIFSELWHKHNIKIKNLPALLVFKDGKLLEINRNIMSRKELSEYVQKFI